MGLQWHAEEVEKVLDALGTTPDGLSSEEAERRLEEYGPNKLVEREGVNPFIIFLGQFKDVFVLMLIAAIVISLLTVFMETSTPTLEDYADSITIGAIVILNSIVGFVQEYRSEKAMEALKRLTAPQARVLRDGREVIIPAEMVVPGDVVLLESGDRIPADGRLIEAIELRTNEAVLTGESTPVEKMTDLVREDAPVSDRRNMVFMGTHVIFGRGRAVITATGMNTEFGKIAGMIQETEEKTPPLKAKLNRFAKKLSIFIVLVCALIFILEMVREPTAGANLLKFFMTAVALAVSAVPEGLPAIVTICLALGARELAKRNAVIRKLAAAETLGSTTVICSDKTGTLTKGEMTVRRIYYNGRIVEVIGSGYEPKGEFIQGSEKVNPENDDSLGLLLRIGALCNNSRLDRDENGWRIIGDTTEGALVVVAHKAGLVQEELEKVYPRVGEIPFSSERKRMTTIHKLPDGEVHAYVKGAPEIILERCRWILKDGEERRLTREEKRRVLRVNEEFANDALRVLGMAYRRLEGFSEGKVKEDYVERDLVFVGLMGMIDPPRDEVKEAIKLCKRAGIKPVMITGDHKLTAVAVAREIGILENGGLVLTGEELDRIPDDEFERIVEDVKVYARVSPEHKLRIVKALKRKGHIVAMTGDGVNDAPALKIADIGVAMGMTGTDVTKESSDMILMDDNFATIVNAVKHGRIIYDNIRKFAFFLMRCNFDELAVIGTFALLGMPLPLTAAMILWINLVTDGGPATALSMDPPLEDVMARPPRDPKQGVLYGRVFQIIISFICQYVGTTVIFLLVYEYGLFTAGMSEPERLMKAQTMCFVQATLRELIIVWNCRSETKSAFKLSWTSNKFLLIAEITSLISTVLILYVPILQVMFGTVPLGVMEWLLVGSIATSGLLLMPEYLYERKVLKWR